MDLPRILILLTTLALPLSGCDGGDSVPNVFPVRLLPQDVSTDRIIEFEARLESEADLEGWQVLAMTDGRLKLEPAPGSSRLLPPEEGDALPWRLGGRTSLIRFLTLPADHHYDVIARVDTGGGDAPLGDPCPSIKLLWLEPLDEGETLDDFLAAGRLRTGPNEHNDVPLPGGLAVVIQRADRDSALSWTTAADESGVAEAGRHVMARERETVWAVVMPGSPDHRAVHSFEVRQRQAFNTAHYAGRGDVEAGVVTPKLWGLRVPSRFSAPGAPLQLPVDVPEETRLLEFQVAIDPAAEAPASADWRAVLTNDRGAQTELGRGAVERPTDLEPSFSEQVLTWPDGADWRGAGCSVTFHVDGDAGLYIGQPLLRGNKTLGRPNLLLISVDTLRADHLSGRGYSRPTSPFLDRLVADSAEFVNYFGVAPYTLPTHATMLSGLLPPRHGAIRSSDRLDTDSLPYLPHLIAQHGYVTAAFTGGGFLADDFGFAKGFDRYGIIDPIELVDEQSGEGEEVLDMLREANDLDRIASWIEDRGDERWFLFMHTFSVHNYEATEEDLDAFRSDSSPTPGHDRLEYLHEREWIEDPPSAGDIAWFRDRYDASIRFTDRMLERFFGRLERQGLLDDTVVVLTSDHGEEFWEHGGFKHSVTLYDEMLRVPLAIRLPANRRSGAEIREPTCQADLTPTLLDLLDIPVPPDLDGHSKAGHVVGRPESTPDTPLFAQIDTALSQRTSLRVGMWKIIRGDPDGDVRYPVAAPIELYDLRADPEEWVDRSADRPDDRARLSGGLEAVETLLRARAVQRMDADFDEDVRRQLRELGYLR